MEPLATQSLWRYASPCMSAPPNRSDSGAVPTLTHREIEVLQRIANGERTKGIAAALGLSAKTVEFHKTKLYSKIGADGAVAAVRWAVRAGYVSRTRPRD
jgi:DNA-binding NarL/FixJ family response regulator